MRCDDARSRLVTDVGATRADAVAAHLDGCPSCAAFARHLLETRSALRAHRVDHLPDAAFAARVVARLPGPTEALGWAALRLLPAAVALALLCTWYGATRGGGDLTALLLRPDDPRLLAYLTLGGEP